MCHWCSYHILTSSVIYYWTDARQHGIYLFYIKLCTHKSCFISRKARESGAFPILINTKKAIWRHLWSIQNEAIPLVAMRSKGLWLVPENHATVKLDLSVASRGMKTCWIIQVSFCHQSSPVSRKTWMLPWILQELKKYTRKTCDCGQSGGHSIRVLNGKER